MARRVASGCLVFHEGNCLLLRRSALEDTMQGLWEMPAGKIESDLDGSPRENAIRETLEEAGIALGDVAPLGEHQTDSKRFYGFLGVSDTADVELSFEHDAFVWMSVPDILAAVAADDMMVGHHTIYFLQELLDGAEGFMYEAESFAAESGDVRINYNANCPACISIMSLIGEEKLETDPANTYWGGGAYQKEVQHLQDGTWPCFECDGRGFFWNIIQEEPELIRERGPTCEPCEGRGEFYLHEPLLVGGIHHNLLGRAGSLLHEYNNNGNGNLLEMGENEECYECGGTGEFDCYSGCDDGKQDCYACDGTGEVEDDEGEDEVCDDCDGSGEEDCNSCEGQSWCNECGGSGEFWNEEIVSGIDNWYQTNVIDYISANGDSDIRYALDRLVDGLESGQLKTTYGQEMYNDANHKLYNDLHDAIVYYVINTPNKPLPDGDTLDAETFSAEKITKEELVDYIDWLEDGFGFYFDNSPRAVRFRDLLAGDLQINSADVDFMDQDEFILLGAEGLPRGVSVKSFKTVSNVYYNGKLYRKFEGRRHRERAESIAEWMMQKLSQNPRRFDYLRFGAEDYSEGDAIADGIIGQTIFNYVQLRDYLLQNLTDEAIEFLDYNIQVAFDELIDEDMRQQVEHVMNKNRFEAEFVSLNNPFKYPSNYVGNLEQDLKQANQVIKMVREICRINVNYDWNQSWAISPSEEFENIVEIIDEKSPANFAGENFEARFVRSLNTPRQPMPWDLEPNMAEEGMPYLTRREYDSMRKIGYTDEEIRNGYQRSFGSESFEAESTSKPARVEIKRATIDPYKLTAVFYDKDDKKIKTTHFGDERYEDYTIHKDKKRLKNYNTRHGSKSAGEKWQKPMTAGALSKWILWNKPSLAGSFADYKRRFKLKGDLKAKTSGGRKRAETFATEYTPSQTLGEYDARELALSNVATGDFFTDSLKFSTTRMASEEYSEDNLKMQEAAKKIMEILGESDSKVSKPSGFYASLGEPYTPEMVYVLEYEVLTDDGPKDTWNFGLQMARKLRQQGTEPWSDGRWAGDSNWPTYAAGSFHLEREIFTVTISEANPAVESIVMDLHQYFADKYGINVTGFEPAFTVARDEAGNEVTADDLEIDTTWRDSMQGFESEEDEDAKKLREYEKTYGKKQAKIRMRLKRKIYKEKSMGTKAGQWSARKSQKLKREYETACERAGLKPYKTGKTEKQEDLEDWSDQKWKTSSGKKSSKTGEPYFPAKAVEALKKKGLYTKAKRQKAKATKAGKQNARYSDDIRKVVAKYRAELWE